MVGYHEEYRRPAVLHQMLHVPELQRGHPSSKFGSQDEAQFSWRRMPHQSPDHATFTENQDGWILPHVISCAHSGTPRPVDAVAFRPTAGLLHDIREAASRRLASLAVPLGKVKENRERGRQNCRLECRLVKLWDSAGHCRHSMLDSLARPPHGIRGANCPRTYHAARR